MALRRSLLALALTLMLVTPVMADKDIAIAHVIYVTDKSLKLNHRGDALAKDDIITVFNGDSMVFVNERAQLPIRITFKNGSLSNGLLQFEVKATGRRNVDVKGKIADASEIKLEYLIKEGPHYVWKDAYKDGGQDDPEARIGDWP